jgi:hypothetical protein
VPDDRPARQFGLTHIDEPTGGAALRRQDRVSPSYTALHRSWMLAERAFWQFASVCRRSVSFASPWSSISFATL